MDNIEKNSILIVDDEKSNLEVLISILNQEYTVLMTKSGSSAIEMASKYSPDLILLDIIMPEMNGFDVIKILKASDKTQNIPVIFITGLVSVEDEEKGLSMGAVDYIHKPFSPKIVKSRVWNQIQIINQIRKLAKLQQNFEPMAKTDESRNLNKSDFLEKMNHEIRTPVNTILDTAGIQLQDKTLPSDIKEAFSRIYDSGNLLLGIINNIPDVSMIDAGKQSGESKASLSSAVPRTLDTNAPASKEAYEKLLDEIAKIGEINTEIGLKRFSDMKEMYCSTLNMFHKKLVAECDDMTVLLETKDLKSFNIDIHGLKSSLSMIGALRLSEEALEIEIASKNQDIDFCKQHFPEFKEKFLSLCKQLSVIFSGIVFLSEEE